MNYSITKHLLISAMILPLVFSCARSELSQLEPELDPRPSSGDEVEVPSSDAENEALDRSNASQFEQPNEARRAVCGALDWLVRHQHPDGHWSSLTSEIYTGNCTDKSVYTSQDPKGLEGYDVGVTALAIIAFLHFGHTHKHGEFPEYRAAQRMAMEWMLKQQELSDPDSQYFGAWGRVDASGAGSKAPERWHFSHALATYAMGDFLIMSVDRAKLSIPVDAASQYCMRSQGSEGGWKYSFASHEADSVVTTWMVKALGMANLLAIMKRISSSKKTIQSHMAKAAPFLDGLRDSSSGIVGYNSPTSATTSLDELRADRHVFPHSLLATTAMYLSARMHCGGRWKMSAHSGLINVIHKKPPLWRAAKGKFPSTVDIHHWYFCNELAYYSSPRGKLAWQLATENALIPHQLTVGDSKGSWPPVGRWGVLAGRVYSTALAAMTLEAMPGIFAYSR